jgi:hypothetical protein
VLALAMAIGARAHRCLAALAQFGRPDEPFVVLTGALVVPNGSTVSDIIFNGTRRSSATSTVR